MASLGLVSQQLPLLGWRMEAEVAAELSGGAERK